MMAEKHRVLWLSNLFHSPWERCSSLGVDRRCFQRSKSICTNLINFIIPCSSLTLFSWSSICLFRSSDTSSTDASWKIAFWQIYRKISFDMRWKFWSLVIWVWHSPSFSIRFFKVLKRYVAFRNISPTNARCYEVQLWCFSPFLL